MFRMLLSAALVASVATPSLAANCITSKSDFSNYKRNIAVDAAASGIGPLGMAALNAATLSGITWRFESTPASQTGVSYGDPAEFLAKRTQSTANAFVQGALRKMKRNPNTFASLERSYGVPASILATIWGLETSWGGYLGSTPIVSSAVTLASYCRRHPRFETHAIAAMRLVDQGVITADTRGGPSGELGHMQFLSGNWAQFGVDGNGDGTADPYNPVDAMASAANMLRANGWRRGEPFGQGTANFEVLSAWNDSGNYQRAIAYAAQQIDLSM